MDILQDPGDESRDFEEAESEITLEDAVVKANGILCGLQVSDPILTGLFSSKNSIRSAACNGGELRHSVMLTGQDLNIFSNLSCRESCKAKLKRI